MPAFKHVSVSIKKLILFEPVFFFFLFKKKRKEKSLLKKKVMTHVKREFMGTCLLSVAQLALAGAASFAVPAY